MIYTCTSSSAEIKHPLASSSSTSQPSSVVSSADLKPIFPPLHSQPYLGCPALVTASSGTTHQFEKSSNSSLDRPASDQSVARQRNEEEFTLDVLMSANIDHQSDTDVDFNTEPCLTPGGAMDWSDADIEYLSDQWNLVGASKLSAVDIVDFLNHRNSASEPPPSHCQSGVERHADTNEFSNCNSNMDVVDWLDKFQLELP